MKKLMLFIFISSLAITSIADSNQSIVISGSLLIDGTGKDPIKNGMVVINEGKIVGVGSNLKIPDGSKVIEIKDGTILPGFFNAHVHEAYDEKLLQAWAREGVTTVRDMAFNPPHSCYEKRNKLNKDPFNSRLVAAGEPLSGGYISKYAPVLIITTEEEARKEANRAFDEGADLLKLMIDSNFNNELMPIPVGKTLVRIAQERGKRVTAHIAISRDIQPAINMGIKEFAHMVWDPIPPELISKIVEAEIYITPTIEVMQIWGAELYVIENLRKFVAAGGQVVLGTDFAPQFKSELGMPLKEILFMQETGMTPMQIIVAGTKNASVVCNLESVLGTLEGGKIADVLVVEGNPLEDLRNLKKTKLVIKGGEVIRK